MPLPLPLPVLVVEVAVGLVLVAWSHLARKPMSHDDSLVVVGVVVGGVCIRPKRKQRKPADVFRSCEKCQSTL